MLNSALKQNLVFSLVLLNFLNYKFNFFSNYKTTQVISSWLCFGNLYYFKMLLYMEFRKMVMITLYAKQKKTHRCTEQTFGLWETARVGCFERIACILSIVKQITSPGGMHETSAQAWCTGKTQRNWVEREVGGGIGMGNTCNSIADSCQCMTKPTTIL